MKLTAGHRMLYSTLWFASRLRSFPHVVLAPTALRPKIAGLMGPGVEVHFISCVLRPGLRGYAFVQAEAAAEFLERYYRLGARFPQQHDPVP